MTLAELRDCVNAAIEQAMDNNEWPHTIEVTVQIDDVPSGSSIWSTDVELHYDGNCEASGCVLLGVLK